VSNIARILLLAGTASLLFAEEASAGIGYVHHYCKSALQTPVSKKQCKRAPNCFSWREAAGTDCVNVK
jgi:hypothetical protein